MFMQLHQTEANSTSHQKMTQYCKEQLHHQRTSSRPNATDTAGRNEPWRQNNTINISSNTFKEQQPDQLVTTDCKPIIRQTPQTSEMDRHASDMENKAT